MQAILSDQSVAEINPFYDLAVDPSLLETGRYVDDGFFMLILHASDLAPKAVFFSNQFGTKSLF